MISLIYVYFLFTALPFFVFTSIYFAGICAAELKFDIFYLLCHGTWWRKGKAKGKSKSVIYVTSSAITFETNPSIVSSRQVKKELHP